MATNTNTIRTLNFLRKSPLSLIFVPAFAVFLFWKSKIRPLQGTKSAFFHNITEVYRPTVNGYKEKVIELLKEKAERASKSELAQKIKVAKGFYTLEMAPPSPGEIKKLQEDIALMKEFMKTGCYKFITVRQAWLLFLVCTEVGLWFYLGETIGKMHIVGYKV